AASALVEPSMLWAYTGIIQSGRYRIRFDDLSVFRLHQDRSAAVQHTFFTQGCCGSRFTTVYSMSGSFYCDQLYRFIVQKMVEHTGSVGTAAYASKGVIW